MPQTAKRAATRSPASCAASRSAKGSGKVRTFAPPPAVGPAVGPAGIGSAGAHTLERCPGCAYTPWPQCAACGAPTVYALEVAGVNGASGEQGHALTLCAACHALLLRLRDPHAEPLRYLPLTTLQTKQAQRPKNGKSGRTQRQTARQTQPAAAKSTPASKPEHKPARRRSRAQGGAA